MELKKFSRIIWVALVLGWCCDFLFWKTSPGINFFLFVVLNIIAGFFLAYGEGIKPSPRSLYLLIPIFFFSFMRFIRQESLTSFVNVVFTLGLLMLLTLTFRNGIWLKYSLSDMVVNSLRLGIGALTGGSTLLSLVSKSRKEGVYEVEGKTGLGINPWAVIRGLILAFPVVFILALLLASADPVFSSELNRLLNIDRWTEYAFRGIYILILAYLLSGVFYYAFTRSREEKLIGVEKPWLSRFLGLTEAAIVLACIDLLFALFVGIQFKYFFGGQANIHIDGYTYAEYARRGFAELVIVAFLSLLIFLGLSSITDRKNISQRRVFSWLGIGLLVLVVCILVSAFQRLVLYESAYGFSRLRAYTYVFMVWLGILLAATVVLELLDRQRIFAIATLFACLGFGLTLNVLNVDAYIVRQNVARAENGSELDTQYLNSLSHDAIPAMFESFITTRSTTVKDGLGSALACQAAWNAADQRQGYWQGFHWSVGNAQQLFQFYTSSLQAYPVYKDPNGNWMVKVNGVEKDCQVSQTID